ncbi:MAG TPA: methyltransferase domain-containing protein [Thermoanaerobaculia bacterium]|nr:methyltransferase domain-containing protein [Thermoanaerobaculia bacterium]HXT52153.1 methyltransferase domain-containing protein [Thermoanaerobaculia bacterium]
MGEDLFARGDEYDAMLATGIRLSGEEKPFFIEGRLTSLFRALPAGWRPRRILDFGCGTGDTAGALAARVPEAEVVGVDVSAPALAFARTRHPAARFAELAELPTLGAFDLCYVNGVLHHVEPARRPETMAAIFAALAPGGRLALFENNAWNPGAWMVMRRIPFDRDAVPMSPREARRLVKDAGFADVELRSLFYFPRPLAALRFLEPALGRLPLGAQIQVLATKPGGR